MWTGESLLELFAMPAAPKAQQSGILRQFSLSGT
jgi:hypothetical protein